MRPSLLDPLFAALTTLPGVGPKLEKLYRRLFGRDDTPARVIDLLFHLPTGTIDRRVAAEAPRRGAGHGRDGRGHGRQPPAAAAEPAARCPISIYASDDTGTLTLTYFHAKRDYLEKLFPVGELRYVSGTTALYDGMLQMVHPDRVVSEAELDKLPMVEPVYPLTEGLTPQPGAQGRRSRADENPEAAGMAGRRPGCKRSGFPALRRRAAEPASSGRARRHPAGEHGLVAARL